MTTQDLVVLVAFGVVGEAASDSADQVVRYDCGEIDLDNYSLAELRKALVAAKIIDSSDRFRAPKGIVPEVQEAQTQLNSIATFAVNDATKAAKEAAEKAAKEAAEKAAKEAAEKAAKEAAEKAAQNPAEETADKSKGAVNGENPVNDGDGKNAAQPQTGSKATRSIECEILVARRKKVRVSAELPENFSAPKPPELQAIPDDAPDNVGERTGRGTEAVATSIASVYDQLSDTEKRRLLDAINVFRGVLYKDGAVAWSFRRAVNGGGAPWEKVLSRTPAETYYSNEFFTFDKVQSDIRRTVSGSLSGSYSGPSAGAAAEVKGGWAAQKKTAKTEVFGYTEIVVPKIELCLSPDRDDLAPDFVAKLNRFAGVDGKRYQDYTALRDLFEEWGAYVPLEFVVGGKLFSTDTKTISSEGEAEAFQLAFRIAVQGAFWSAKLAAQYSSDSTSRTDHQAKRAFLQAVGGDPGLVNSPPQWVASCGAFEAWRPCRVARLVPIYAWSSEDVQRGLYKTLATWAEYWKEDPVMLDFEQYLVPLHEYGCFKFPKA